MKLKYVKQVRLQNLSYNETYIYCGVRRVKLYKSIETPHTSNV